MRELFIDCLKLPKTLAWIIPIEISLSISGLYELIEWAVADLLFKSQGVAYLGIQGDVWDAQKDMFLAFSGALIGSSLISILEKKQAERTYNKPILTCRSFVNTSDIIKINIDIYNIIIIYNQNKIFLQP